MRHLLPLCLFLLACAPEATIAPTTLIQHTSDQTVGNTSSLEIPPQHELQVVDLPPSLSGVEGQAPGLLMLGESHVVEKTHDGVLIARVDLEGTLWIEHHDRDETGEPIGVASVRQSLGQGEAGFQLAWVGDIDQDGALDLIVEGPPQAGARPERRLWTSRLAGPGELRGLRFARILPRAQG